MRNTLAALQWRSAPQARQRGLTIIELLIGVALGLLVVTGAIKLAIDLFSNNRRLLLETRVNQDLRAAADLIARDIRRAGYWASATSGIFSTTGTGTAAPNPYIGILLNTETQYASKIEYQYERDTTQALVQPSEEAGFLVNSGVLKFKNGGAWQEFNKPSVVSITELTISSVAPARKVELSGYCACMTSTDPSVRCDQADFAAGGGHVGDSVRPFMEIRQFDIVLKGEAAADASVRREIRETVRVRNDKMSGCCPKDRSSLGICPSPS